MTTLKNKQSGFLANYSMMLITDKVNEKLTAFRKGDEWKNALEEGKKSKKNLDKVEEERKHLTHLVKLDDIRKQIKELDSNYVLAYKATWNNSLEHASFYTPDDIEKNCKELLNNLAENDAVKATGCRERAHAWHTPLDKVQTEIRARLSIEPNGNFDEIVDTLVNRFDIEKLFQELLEANKDNSDTDVEDGPMCDSC